MSISATFQANFDQFITAARGAQQSLSDISGTAEKMAFAVTASLVSTEVRRFAGDVRRTADQFIGAFAEEEAAVSRLQTALAAQGTEGAIAQYQALASQFQATTVFSDDLIIGMEALLVQVGNVMPEQMGVALQAATNLSAGLGVDLRTATMLVGKVFEGETGTLKRYGIVIDEAKLKADPLAATLEAINAKFGGQAVAQLETYSGRTAALGNQISDLKEKGGKLLVDALTPILNAFMNLPEPMQTTIATIGIIGAALAPLALSFAAVVTVIGPLVAAIGGAAGLTAVLGALAPFLGVAGIIAAGIGAWVYVFKNADVFVWAAVTAWGRLKDAFSTAATAITRAARDTYDGIKTWLIDRFQVVVDSIKAKVDAISGFFKGMYDRVVGNSYVPDMIRGIGQHFSLLDTVMVAPTSVAVGQVTREFEGLLGFLRLDFTQGWQGTLASLFQGTTGLDGIVRNGLQAFGNLLIPGFGSILSQLAPVIASGLQKLGGLFASFFSSVWDGLRSIGRGIKDLFTEGFSFGGGGDADARDQAIRDYIEEELRRRAAGGGGGSVAALPATLVGGLVNPPLFSPSAGAFAVSAPTVVVNVEGNILGTQEAVSQLISDSLFYRMRGAGMLLPGLT